MQHPITRGVASVHGIHGMNPLAAAASLWDAAAASGYGQRDKQIIKPYTSIRLDDLLDLSRTPGAVCQSIHRRNAPEVDAGKSLE